MSQRTWFISDLHLDAKRPQMVQAFMQFLGEVNGQADALYILGDLFEYWIGDDIVVRQPVRLLSHYWVV